MERHRNRGEAAVSYMMCFIRAVTAGLAVGALCLAVMRLV